MVNVLKNSLPFLSIRVDILYQITYKQIIFIILSIFNIRTIRNDYLTAISHSLGNYQLSMQISSEKTGNFYSNRRKN